MATRTTASKQGEWRQRLPVLTARTVTLREPTVMDHADVFELLSAADATRFGLEEPLTDIAVMGLLERVPHERAEAHSLTYVITLTESRTIVGLIQIRQLDFGFENAECEMSLAPLVRGTGVFVESARLIGSFLFGTVGTYRIECRVAVHNGRASGALRKLGAVEEGVLRRSLRRGGEYVDQVLWSLLREDWGDNWVSTSSRVH
jgi:ribosomal-protein-alanine N-acetyltransferase